MIGQIEIGAPMTADQSFSFAEYTDSVSDSLGIADNCGLITYTILDSSDVLITDPTEISVTRLATSSEFQITVGQEHNAQTTLKTYKLVGTLDDYSSVTGTLETLTVNFEGACESGTIVDQSIILDAAIRNFDPTKDYYIGPFLDTVDTDVAFAYPFAQGACGEKEFDIPSLPAFLTLTIGTDPLIDPITLHYDDSLATDDDIMVHEIQYTVTSADYSSWPIVTGTF